MLTYSQSVSLLQQMTKVNSQDTTNTALLVQFWNESIRAIASMRSGNWPWLEITKTVETVADQDYVYIPNDMRKVSAVRVVVGTGTSATVYLPRLVYNPEHWETVLAMRLGTNQYPYYCYQQGQKLLFSPIPSDTGTDVILIGRKNVRDLSIADYTTGTIVTATNGSTAIVGSGTTWTKDMIGRYIRITETTAANGGDGFWYEIGGWTNSTNITLTKPYEGTSIAAGSAAYTIGQVPVIPEAYQLAPIYRAVWQYFQINDPLHQERWGMYAKMYDGGQEAGLSTLVGGFIGQMLEEAAGTFEGAYIPPGDKDFTDVQQAPYYFPNQLASGF